MTTDPRTFWHHDTAIVDAGARIGAGTKIWHFSHVCGEAVVIGTDCSFGQNTYVGKNVKIGNGVRVQNNVSIYDLVTLEDDVFCGPSVVFTNVVNPRAHVSRKHEFKATLICRGATLGANCTIVCGATLGEYAFIGAGSVVTKDVPAYSLQVGNPSRHRGWMCRCGVKLGDDLLCVTCGATYHLEGPKLIAETKAP